MVSQLPGSGFGAILRTLRKQAGLTQRKLAEISAVSERTISDLERHVNKLPRAGTAELLAKALILDDLQRALFEAAARGQAPATESAGRAVTAASPRTLPSDIASFTGREPELSQLMDPAAAAAGIVGIHAIDGMAGIGKTALAVHAAHMLAARFPDGQIFLPLHAHTPGRRPVDPADALATLLLTGGADPQQVYLKPDLRAELWRDHLAGKRILLLLDDAASSDQVRPLLPGAPGSMVLVTSRRRLTALHGLQAVSLDILSPADAAALLVQLAGRRGLSREDPAVADIAALCGFLPLAISILGSKLQHHPSWAAADALRYLAAARTRLAVMNTDNLSVAAAFDLSYQDLTAASQHLFRRLGLHTGTDIDAYAAAALGGIDPEQARRHLEEMYDQNLLAEPAPGRYRMHDLIREHARILTAADPMAEREAAVGRLLTYYQHATWAAGRHLSWRIAAAPPLAEASRPGHLPELATQQDARAWMEIERLNLHASVEYAAARGDVATAVQLLAGMHAFLQGYGHWDQAIFLHEMALDAAHRAGDRTAEAQVRTDLGCLQYLTDAYAAANENLRHALELYGGTGDRLGTANAYHYLGAVQSVSGRLQEAITSLSRARQLYRDVGNQLGESVVLNKLGAAQRSAGAFAAAASSLTDAVRMSEEFHDPVGVAGALNNLGHLQRLTGDLNPAISNISRALGIYRECRGRLGEANALNNLGALQALTGEADTAFATLSESLELYRDLGDQLGEASALSDLGVAHFRAGDLAAARAALEQAREIFDRLDNEFGQVEVLNSLGELCLAAGGFPAALAYHSRAFRIAARLALPLEEARAREGTGRCQLATGSQREGIGELEKALALYDRMGAFQSERVRETLRQAGGQSR